MPVITGGNDDCEHPEVGHEVRFIPLPASLVAVHRFKCSGCNVCARITQEVKEPE